MGDSSCYQLMLHCIRVHRHKIKTVHPFPEVVTPDDQ